MTRISLTCEEVGKKGILPMGSLEDKVTIPRDEEQQQHTVPAISGNASFTEAVCVPLGRVGITPGAERALEAAAQNALQVLTRHHFGDWGELEKEDWERNNHALEHGLRLLSAYRLRNGVKVWVITESDRSCTTVLTPEEY